MLHDYGDGIGFRVERDEETIIRALRHRALAQFFVVAKQTYRVLQIGT
jgi:hypothetical protein